MYSVNQLSQIMKSVFSFAVFLLLASSCSCSREMPWSATGYSLDDISTLTEMPWSTIDYSLEKNIDYSSSFENDIHARGASSFSVMNYGAAGNGQTDDSQAFRKAWNDVCGASQHVAILQVPAGKTFLLSPFDFRGPCKANAIHFQLQGTLVAPGSTSWAKSAMDSWISFSEVQNLIIDGGGKFDGQGSIWWQHCKKKTFFGSSFSCQNRPGALHFHNCNGLQIKGVTHVNSPRTHISIDGCKGVIISNLQIIAPWDSPNTDGIDISSSSNVKIEDSRIGTGDDCVAINGGASSINITGVHCGPGHGISIGSLGQRSAYETVEDVHVKHCVLTGTQNGVRIKTYKGGSGFARKISFDDIILDNVQNPIIIDQFYMNKYSTEASNSEAVHVSDVTYSNIRGTSATGTAINLNCDNSVGCNNIVMNNVGITSALSSRNVYSYCNNAHGSATLVTPKVPCL